MRVEPSHRYETAETVFRRVLVGVDQSDESREAALQAATLAGGAVTLLAAYDVATLIGGSSAGVPSFYDEDLQHESASNAIKQALEVSAVAEPTIRVVRGVAWHALLDEAERQQSTLIAVGSHGGGRLTGIVTGSVTTAIIHKAPCSVLVARHTAGDFPSRIVVGVDGSTGSSAAYAVAVELANQFNAELWPVVAYGGQDVDPNEIKGFVSHHIEALPDDPVTALVTVAANADLLVVGSRGLHGLRRRGSVSERVAHQAHSSVLIVRQPVTGEAKHRETPSRGYTSTKLY